jgi:hypothetical protein
VYLEISQQNRYMLAVEFKGNSAVITHVFDVKTGDRAGSFPGFGSFDDTGDAVVLRLENALMLAEIATGKTETIVEESCISAQKAGNMLCFLTRNGQMKRWDTQAKKMTVDVALDLEPAYLTLMRETYYWKETAISRDGARCAFTLALSDVQPDDTLGQTRFIVFDTGTGKAINDHLVTGTGVMTNHIYSPDLQYYVTAPLEDNGSWQNLMRAFSTADGKFSHVFGLPALEGNLLAHFMGQETWMTVYNQGKLIRFDRPFNPVKDFPSFIYHTETGRSELLDPADSLTAYAAKHGLQKDERWLVVCKDRVSYQIIDAQTNNTVATLLIAEGQTNTWAVSVPSGLFDASPDMMESLHYVSGMDIIDLEQLKERYYEPGLLAKVFGLSLETPRSVEALNAVDLYPEMHAKLSDDKLGLLVDLEPRSGGIGKISLFVNGKEVMEDANPHVLLP